MRKNIIGARFSAEDIELLKKVCEARGEDFSSFLRRAVKSELARLSFYTPEVKKALGIEIPEKVTP
jgi:hypothetical protein